MTWLPCPVTPMYRKCAPAVGMSVTLLGGGDRINPSGKIVRLREPLGTADIELDSGEVRYCITNDPYSGRVYWAKC